MQMPFWKKAFYSLINIAVLAMATCLFFYAFKSEISIFTGFCMLVVIVCAVLLVKTTIDILRIPRKED